MYQKKKKNMYNLYSFVYMYKVSFVHDSSGTARSSW